MALPCRTTGSLYPAFAPARLVSLTVKLPYAIALRARLPTVLREPLKASDTLSEATTPVKLPTTQCPILAVWLGTKRIKGGISPLTPRDLAAADQCLPPILHIIPPVPMRSYSKGAWGLSVP